jgi:membrane-bound ClpP family serine protease
VQGPVRFAASLFLLAVGAILDFALDIDTAGFTLNTIGLILMIIGAISLALSLTFWTPWGGDTHHRTPQ